MKIYDISQEVFSCGVYPGDPKPEKQTLCATGAGDLYNLTAFSMCAIMAPILMHLFIFCMMAKRWTKWRWMCLWENVSWRITGRM